MLCFYMDHHIQRVVTERLRRRGIDVLTAFEDGTAEVDDELLLLRATKLGRLLVTHDKGFLRIASRWRVAERDFAGIVFTAQEALNPQQVVDYLELVSHAMSVEEMRNRVEFVPLR